MSSRHISDVGLQLLQRYERYVPTPYDDGYGFQTIGWGHLIRPGEVFTYLSPAEADDLLRRDLATAERAVLRLITVPLHALQFDALVSFTYNAGSGTLQRSTLRQKVNRGDHAEVVKAFALYRLSAGRISKGLVRRRKDEAALYQRGWLETLPWRQ
jgi:lysozyme